MLKMNKLLLIFFLLCNVAVKAQERTITGTVSSTVKKTGILGASVSQKGTKTGTSTDENGNFAIKVSGSDVVLIFSSVGFASKEIAAPEGTSILTVNLDDDSRQLGEVVVTALGITRQAKTLVYATQTVKPAELTGVRDPNNILNSLQGKVANAVITQGSGGPGSGAKIVLRGNRSIQGDNNALIVVDGVPINNGTNGTAGSDFGSVQGSDGASNINPDDIESATILRGASAAALYGSAAGNGVIVITTKKGTKDKIAITVNSGVAFEKAFSLPKVQDSYGQGNSGILRTDTVVVTGESWGPKMAGQTFINHLGEQSTYTAQPDNIKDFFRTGVSFNNSIGISGGNDKMQTYFSYTNNSIQGIIEKNNLMRHNINLRISNQFGKRFSTDAKITYINQRIDNRPRTGEENAPTIDIYQIPRNVSTDLAKRSETIENDIPKPTQWPSTLSSIYQNPYWMINRTALNEKRDRIIGFITAKFKITDWLTLQGRANLDKTMDRTESIYSTGTVLWASQFGGYYDQGHITSTQQWYDVMLEGSNKITNDIQVDYRAGAIFQDNLYDQVTNVANGLNVPNKFSLNFATNPAINSIGTQVQTQSIFGQVNFSYKNFLFVDASLRNDWDSRLPSPYSFSYPSVGASLIISDMVTLPSFFSFLKASGSYASVGNGGQPQVRISTYGYSQGAGTGFLSRSSTLPIPGLKPEIVQSLEFGVDARFLKNMFGFSLTYYNSNSKNQLLLIPLPTATGYANKYINAGKIKNSGIELVVTASPIKKKDFSWDLSFNFGYNKNEIVELSPDLKTVYLAGGFGRSGTPVIREGGSYGDLLAYQWKRDSKGALVVNADGTPLTTDITKDERGLVGNFNPKTNYGLTNSFEYKRFSFRVLIDGRAGGVMVSGTEMNLAFSGIPEVTENYREGGWNLGGVNTAGQPVAATITSQQFWQKASQKRYGVGEFFTYNTTNFRVREVSLGYSIPMGEKSILKDARISIVARNLFWLYRGKSTLDIPGLGTRKMWFDPDMALGNGNYQGVEYGTLPATRSLGFNLKLTF
jgi:TonB-linked SusC/RagA family outer membrane protein